MDAIQAIARAQRFLVCTAVLASAAVMWVSEGDIFALPKATAIWLCAVLCVGLSAVRWGWTRVLALPADPASIAAGAFLVAMAITTATSTTPAQSLVGQYSQNAGLLSYGAYVVLFVVVLRTYSPARLPELVRVFVVGAVLVVAYAVLQVLDVDPAGSIRGPVVSTLGNPNFLGGWIGIFLPVCLWAAFAEDHHVAWRVAGGATALAIPVVAAQIDSFQGPVTVGASAVVFVLLALRIPKRFLLIGGALLAVVLVVLAPRIRDQIENGLLEREFFWPVAVEVGLDNPIVGTGPDTFHNQFLERRPPEHASVGGENAGAAHDVPLDMFANGGLLLLLPYLAFVGLVGWRLLRGIRRAEGDHRLLLAGIGAAWVGYQVQSLVSIDKPPLALSHFVLAACVLVATGPQRWFDIALPGTTVRARQQVPAATWVVSGVAVVLAVIGAWLVSRPLRADMTYAAGVDALQRGDAAGVEQIEEALDLAPWEARYTFELARGRAALGDGDGALAAAEEGARLEPGDGSYALVVAQLARGLGDEELTYEWIAEALRRDRYGMPELTFAVRTAAAFGDDDRLDEFEQRILEVYDHRWDIWRQIFWARQEIGDTAGADEAMARTLELNPDAEFEEEEGQ